MRLAIVAASILLAATAVTALADPAPIKLTRAQIIAASDAAKKQLPPVDKAQAAQCQKSVDAYNANPSVTPLMTAAACYRTAGSLGAAIMMWQQVEYQYRAAPEAKEALHQLGPAYEAAGDWHDAAMKEDEYAEQYGGEKDARDLEVRALCTWEQLGLDDQIRRGLYNLTHHWPKVTVDPDHLCDTIRPIPVVAP
jgi:hypothetical protein